MMEKIEEKINEKNVNEKNNEIGIKVPSWIAYPIIIALAIFL